MRKSLQLAFLLLSLLGWGCDDGLAHASLVSSIPLDGTVLSAVPSSLILQFNEPIAVTSVRLTSSDGSQRDLRADVQNEEVVVSIPPDVPPGSQVVSYRVISADGHPVSG